MKPKHNVFIWKGVDWLMEFFQVIAMFFSMEVSTSTLATIAAIEIEQSNIVIDQNMQYSKAYQQRRWVPLQHFNTLLFLDTIQHFKILTDTQIEDFNTQTTKERALELVRSGNMFVEKLRLLEASIPTADINKRDLIMVQMPMQASQNQVTYNVLVAFEKTSGKCMPSPFSHCSCPAGTHCCSHFLGALLVIKHTQLFHDKICQLEQDPQCKWRIDIINFTKATITKCSQQVPSNTRIATKIALFRPQLHKAQAMLKQIAGSRQVSINKGVKQTDTNGATNFAGMF